MEEQIKKEFIETVKKVIRLLRNQQLITFEIFRIKTNPKLEKYIHHKAMQKIYRYQNQADNEINHAIIIISLSLIAFDYYDGDFWSYVRKVYDELYRTNQMRDEWLDSRIREIIGNIMPDDISPARKISYILWQPIVPYNYLDDFYNILLVVFLNDLRRSLPEEVNIIEGLLKTIFQQISKKSNQDSDNIKSVIMNQAYKFIQSTRDVINHPRYRSTLAKFSRYIIQSIATEINYAVVYDEIPQYFSEWSKSWFTRQGEKKSHFIRQQQIGKSQQKIIWKVEFSFENQVLILNTKTLFLPPDVDYKKISIEVISGEQQVYFNNQPRIIDNDLSVELVSAEMKVNFSPFDLIVRVNGLDIADEPIKVDFLMFDLSGNRLIKSLKNKDEIYVLSKNLSNSNVKIVKRTIFYDVGYLDTSIEENLIIDGVPYSLKKYHKSEIIGTKFKQGFITFENRKIDIYQGELFMVHPKVKGLDKTVLWINNKFIDINYNDEIDDIMIQLKWLKVGINVIEIKDNENKNLPNCRWEIFYDNNLNISYDKDSYQFEMITSLSKSYNGIFDPHNDESIIVPFKVETTNLIMNYHPFLPMISVNGKKFEPINEYLWHEDFGYYDEVVFKGINADKVMFFDDNKTQISTTFQSSTSEIGCFFKFIIGFLKTNHSDININIIFYKNDEMIYNVKFLNLNEIDKKDIFLKMNYETSTILFIIDKYWGKDPLHLIIYNEDEQIQNIEISNNRFEKKIDLLYSPSVYKFLIYNKQIEIYKKEMFYIITKDIIGKVFKIDDIAIMVTTKISKDDWLYRLDYDTLRNVYIKIQKYDEERKKFIGCIKIRKFNGDFSDFKKVRRVTVDFYQGIIKKTRIPAIIETYEDEEALYFDVIRHRIIDEIEEPQLTSIATIDEYVLNIEETL